MASVETAQIDAGMLTQGSVRLHWSRTAAAAPPRTTDPGGVKTAGGGGGQEHSRPKRHVEPPGQGSGGASGSGSGGSERGPGTGGSGRGGGGRPTGNSGPLPTDPGVGNTPVGGPISRKEILERARYWARKGVPYSMSAYTNDPQGKSYRTDCSGLVSMALHLDSSLSTVTLPSQVERIDKSELQPGDIVGNLGGGTAGAAGHVMIFNGWVDESKTAFYTIEETPPRAVERTRTWGSHAYTSGAYRYRNVTD